MSRDALNAFREIELAWNEVIASIGSMNSSAEITPYNAASIFKHLPDYADGIKFLVEPIVFKVPEEADNPKKKLFVVVSGWVVFESMGFDRNNIRTKTFGTWVAYFREKGEVLRHVYGAHYDIDEALFGHPVLHGQVSTQTWMSEEVNKAQRITFQVEDDMKGVLKTVRVPTAQMDVFSVIQQLCADHLLDRSLLSGQKAFRKISKACRFFKGVGHRMEFLNNGAAPTCYRSPYWYDGQAPV